MKDKIRLHSKCCFLCKYADLDLNTSKKCIGCFVRSVGFELKNPKQREADGILQDEKGYYVMREVRYAENGDDSEQGVDIERVSEGSGPVDNGDRMPEVED